MKRHEISQLLTKEEKESFSHELTNAIHEVNIDDNITTRRKYASRMKSNLKAVERKYESLVRPRI